MKSKKTWKRLLSVLLTVSIVITTIAPSTAVSAAENSSTEISVSTQDDDNTPQTTVSSDDVETSNADKTDDAQDTSKASLEQSQSQQADNDKTEGASTKAATDTNLYQNGSICIYNEQQLKAIGTETQVHEGDASADTFGTGAVLTDEEGNTLTYAADGSYTLMNDIPLTKENIWTLPEGFAGSFQGAEITAEKPLYDAETDTIYVYNNYQLATINDPDAIKTVMSNDMIASEFGVGQVVYTDEEKKTQLEYTADHNYVLSKDFTEQMPEMKATQVQAESTVQLGGRDYIGQVHKVIGDKDYILIGNEQQLREIGEDTQVTPALYMRVTKAWGAIKELYPYYPGDADFNIKSVSEAGLNTSTFEEADYSYFKAASTNHDELMKADFGDVTGLIDGVLGILGTVVGGLGDVIGGLLGYGKDLVGLTDDGIITKDAYKDSSALANEYKNLKYSSDANYIIFRDIDLSQGDFSDKDANNKWDPLMFSGNMIGAIANGNNTLESIVEQSVSGGIVDSSIQATISNIVVDPDSIKVEETSGVGFFGTIMNESKNRIGVSDSSVSVENLKLQNITVNNNVEKIEDSTGLIGTITGALGDILGGLLGNLGKVLDNLLNPSQNKDNTVFATGTFAGRISGDVIVENCDVEGILGLTNQYHDMTGGFAGNIEGVTEYGKLQQGLGDLIDILESVLNVIPFVDLGTLIEILLEGNIINVEQLIPTGYYNPQIIDCHVTSDNLNINSDYNFNGGFVGRQVGAIIKNSSVKVNTLNVTGKNLNGGFSGLTANAELVGLLEGLGVDLVKSIKLNSYLLGCDVQSSSLTISSTEKYAGGLTGSFNNSFSVDSGVNVNDQDTSEKQINISAGDYAGGIAGSASIAQSIALGTAFYQGQKDLVSLLGNIVGDIAAGDSTNVLLSLTGVSPSVIAGNTINGKLTVSATNTCAGGIAGQADGVKIIPSFKLNDESFIWKQNSDQLNYTPKNKENSIPSLVSVSADSFAGGIVGKNLTASAAGILNKTLGVASYIGFTVDSVTVTGSENGYSISATDNYAGGAFGQAIGGNAISVVLNNISTVTAKNYAGGFAGDAGTGSLANGGGLNILGLDLAKIDNLLSLAEGVCLNIKDSQVNGIADGLSVSATGVNSQGSIEEFVAGGFIGESKSVVIENSKVTNLKSVTADTTYGYAGGFTGTSETGGLAGVVQTGENKLPGIVDINGLLRVVPYLIPEYKNCTVTYVSNNNKAQINAAVAGGFIADMQSGTIDNTGIEDHIAVYNLENVTGTYYAGGFAGRATSGGLASAGGLSLLKGLLDIDITNLLSLLETYIPVINNASVSSVEDGFVVSAKQEDKESSLDAVGNSGSAGGFIGYGSGVQISSCDVNKLKNTNVTPPTDLEAQDGSSYFGENSNYAVTAARYSGGFIGKMDIGSAAAVGSGLSLLEKIDLSNVLSALSVVTSTIEQSNVFGAIGGYSVLANNGDDQNPLGNAGGFAGSIYGGHVQYSHANNFEYVIGQETAGGYVGNMEPGNVASVLGETTVLGGLVSLPNDLLDVAETFVPTIRNSYTTCVPCGGVVRADASSSIIKKSETTDPDKQEENNESESTLLQKGMAGGYVGHSAGGQIWGNNADNWKNAVYTGEQTECAVKRIRSVYGAEYAGGFSGYMECASTASSGSLSLLYDFVKTENLLGLLNAIYPTDENTAVYGPLLELDMTTWNNWVNAVGDAGAYADELKDKGAVTSDDELKELINSYAYGYSVVAGREQTDTISASDGNAGGYTGSMVGGVITNATATGVKKVYAIQGAAGGFAGKMLAGGVASVGETSIAGLLSLNGNLLGALQTFVPVIKESSVEGYQSGAVITATGQSDSDASVGCAGGYVGHMLGGQIQGKIDSESIDPAPGCNITKLRSVEASVAAGGYAGRIDSGAAADVNTNALGGAIGDIINKVIGTSGSIASVLKTIVSTVHYAKVETVDSYGIIVQTTGDQAEAAGGFVGIVQGAVLGSEEEDDGLQAIGIRAVTGAEQAGGFLGIGDVAAVAKVAGGGDTTILGLIEAGAIDVLDAFRPYIYEAKVVGSQDGNGLTVTATKERSEGSGDSLVYIGGNAGGFGGSFLNGTVTNSTVENLKSVKAPNYTGGFIGYSGKSGVVDANKVDLGDGLLDLNAGILDVFGSHINYCNVSGLDEGYTVQSTGGHQEIAGGFIGYADLSRMEEDTASNVRQVYSDEIAGGFVGKTSMAYLVSVDVNSKLLDPILKVVNGLIKALYLDDLQDANFVELGIPEILEVEVLSDGKTLGVTLFGLHITVALSEDDNGETDVAIITIGDSEIKLPCSEKGVTNESDAKGEIANAGGLEINLIKANRTKIEKSTVTGISVGYDVFGGGASNDKDGISDKGYAGGFAGYNHAGLLEENHMIKADTVRGTANKIGEFSGCTNTDTSYDALEDPTNIEKANTYQVYRTTDQRLTVVKKGDIVISRVVNTLSDQSGTIGEICHTINHLETIDSHDEWQDVYMTTNTETSYVKVPIKVYVSAAQADLMYGVETYISTGDETAKPGEMQDPCDETVNITIQKVWKDNDNSVGEDHKRPASIIVELYQNGTLYQNDPEHSEGKYEITGDTSSNVWSITIPELPAVYEENGTYKNYTYTVKEVESQEEYITEYTKDENGYNYVITNTHTSTLVETDSVVIDFGLPVKVNVLKNDAVKEAGTLSGISDVALNDGNIYDVTTDNNANKNEVVGKFGTATVEDVKNGIISYQLTTMQMESFDQFTYSVETKANTINGEGGDGCYIYSTLTIIPATTIYYEDNASMISYIDYEYKEGVEPETSSSGYVYGKWYTLKNDENEYQPEETQDTDRPGIAKPGVEQVEDDMDSIYGYDTHYTTSNSSDTSKTKYSNGSTHFVEVKNGISAEVSFVFTGTGFDVISLTDNDTGLVKVSIEEGSLDTEGEFTKQKDIKQWAVDTYYGYSYDTSTGKWKVDPLEGENALYQIPVIRYSGLENATYKVTITPVYTSLFDHNKKQNIENSYNFYLDAVRIYNPANVEQNQIIKDVYKADAEYKSTFKEIRDIIVEAKEFEEPSTKVYIDGVGDADWELYKDAGPSHELYLAPGQKIAMTLYANEIPTSVRIGVKSIQDSVKFTVGFSVNESGQWKEYMITPIICNTATDLYYDITEQCIWEEIENTDENGYKYKTTYPVTITNTLDNSAGSSIISLTQLKYIINETDQ